MPHFNRQESTVAITSSPAATTIKNKNNNLLNPLACEEDEYEQEHNNRHHYNDQHQNDDHNNHNNDSSSTATMLAASTPTAMSSNLRAASHVSFEHTPEAHEYQPCCPCTDCKALVENFTNFSILDEYVAVHLKYERTLENTYNFVPKIDGNNGEFGYTTVHVGNEACTSKPIYEEKYCKLTSSFLFHFHVHTMTALPIPIRQRSLNRYYEITPPRSNRSYYNNNNHFNKKNFAYRNY